MRTTRWVPPALALGVLLGAPRARAQSAQEIAARRTMIQRAQGLAQHGDHAQALDLATRAGRIQMTASLRLFIAQEQGSLGQVAEAFGNTDLCVREAQSDPSPNRAEIQRECQALQRTLQTRVGFISVNVAAPAPPGLVVQVNGVALSDVLYGTPYVVTPGRVVVNAAAAGYLAFHRDASVGVGQTLPLAVTLQRDPNYRAPSAVVAAPVVSVLGPDASRRDAPPGGGVGHLVGPIVVTGVGVLTLASAGVFFLLRNGALGNCTSATGEVGLCDTPADVSRAQADAPLFNTVTNVTLIAGGVIAAGGLVWLILARPSGGGAAQRVSFGAAPGGAGLVGTLEGRF